ncbi:SET and MYND domain-containing [Chlorella sorokiniana]|uniref:SET and MYND domain-containing n=1 Tax=Chlorella sorokiniana TaxID=3076 RepID=A0A2P6TP13_CHLSO|nr:SET and MYND domain-containing [Chlorella sorokiniana]|eukprot:PRW51076.1 SET and MYND domain-containing [Chlorella sorokiniana]
MLAAVAPTAQRSQLEAALAAFRQAEGALALCRRQRLLPAMWLQTLGGAMAVARQLLPSAQAQLHSMGASQHKSVRPLTGTQRRAQKASLQKAAGAAAQAAAEAGAQLPQRCGHCGKAAVGLRRCAQCRRTEASYCSRACQVAAWPQHKFECREA